MIALDDMQDKTVLIKQPAGIGDIIFLSKLYYFLIDSDIDVVWPVAPNNLFLNDYLEDFNLVNINNYFPFKAEYNRCGNRPLITSECVVINTHKPGIGPNSSLMRSKYALIGQDCQGWAQEVRLKRKKRKENKLKKQVLKGIQGPFAFVNRNYFPWHAPNKSFVRGNVDKYDKGKDKVATFKLETELPVVDMSYIEGYSVVDWLGVMEEAAEIHTIDTSITLLAETCPPLKASKLHCYCRHRTINFITYLYEHQNWDIWRLRDKLAPEDRVRGVPSVDMAEGDIPKVIHFIWVGSPLDASRKSLIEEARKTLPDWEIKVWTEVPDDMPLDFRSIIKKCTYYCEVADIMRYWILYTQGGVYMDTDTLVVKDLSPLLKQKTFLGRQPNGKIANGVIGSVAGSRTLEIALYHCLLRKDWGGRARFGPSMWTPVYGRNIDGMCDSGVKVYPATVFHPVRNKKECHTYWKSSTSARVAWLRRHGLVDLSGDNTNYTITLWGVEGSSHARVSDQFRDTVSLEVN